MVSTTTRRIVQVPPSADYSSGSIVPYVVGDDGTLYFGLGREAITADNWCEQLKWSALGGSCKPSDVDVAQTASREFSEECMGIHLLAAGSDALSIHAGLARHVPSTVHMVTEKNNHDCIHAYYFMPARANATIEEFARSFAERRAHLLNLKSAADRLRSERLVYQRALDQRFILGADTHENPPVVRAIRDGREVVRNLPASVDPAALSAHVRSYNDFVEAIQMEPDVNVQLSTVRYTDASGELAAFVSDVRVPNDVLELQELKFFSEHELMRMIEDHLYVSRRRFRQRLIHLIRFALPIFRQRRLRLASK